MIETVDYVEAAPRAGFHQPAIKLNPRNRDRPSKVGIYDEIVTTSDHSWQVGDLLTWWYQIRAAGGLRKLFDFEYVDLCRELSAAGRATGVGHVTPYELRHGGASDGAALGFELAYLQKRRRWATHSSVVRYGKPGIFQESWSLLSSRSAGFVQECEKAAVEVVTGAKPWSPLPWW